MQKTNKQLVAKKVVTGELDLHSLALNQNQRFVFGSCSGDIPLAEAFCKLSALSLFS